MDRKLRPKDRLGTVAPRMGCLLARHIIVSPAADWQLLLCAPPDKKAASL